MGGSTVRLVDELDPVRQAFGPGERRRVAVDHHDELRPRLERGEHGERGETAVEQLAPPVRRDDYAAAHPKTSTNRSAWRRMSNRSATNARPAAPISARRRGSVSRTCSAP